MVCRDVTSFAIDADAIPKSPEVEINGGTSLEIKDCIYSRKKGEPLFAGPCISQAEANIGELAPLPFLADAKSWAVNGKVRGSAKTGTILDLTPEAAYYSAPDNQRTVTVSVKSKKGKVLSAPIKVVAPHVDVVVAMAEPNSVMPCIFGYGSVDDGASFSLGADATTGKLVAKDLMNQTAMTTTFVTTGTVTQDVQPIWDIKKVTVLTANQDAAGNQQVELQLDVTRQGGVCTWTLPESEPIVSDPGPVQEGKVGIVLKFNAKDLPKTITSPQTTGYKFTVQKP